MKIKCSICKKEVCKEEVSTEVKAYIICLECLEKQEVKKFKEWMREYNQGLIDLDTWLMEYKSMMEV